jgi:nitroreductase
MEVRKVSRESLDGFRNMMLGTVENPAADHSAWNSKQAYIALGFFLSAAAVLGVDACPMEGFDSAKYDEILGLKEKGLTAQVIATAGYRASDDAVATWPKVRFAENDTIIRM